jgi:hypothetical protein
MRWREPVQSYKGTIMSKISENKKYLTLEGVRVSYRPKDDTIHLTSIDEDLAAEGFHLTLKQGSDSESILRSLLLEKGLIRPDEARGEFLDSPDLVGGTPEVRDRILRSEPTPFSPHSTMPVSSGQSSAGSMDGVITQNTGTKGGHGKTNASFISKFAKIWKPNENTELPTRLAGNIDKDTPWDVIRLGVAKSGYVDWQVNTFPHMLLAGATGSGKSVIQRNIFFHCLRHNEYWKFFGIDLKRVELAAYNAYKNTTAGIATTVAEALMLLQVIDDEMMRRYDLMEYESVNNYQDLLYNNKTNSTKAIMVLIDEATMLLAPSGSKTEEGKAEDAAKIEIYALLMKLVRLGRAAGIHIVTAAQRPDATVFTSEFKANLDVRIAAGRMDSTPSSMILDSGDAMNIPPVKGRGIIKFGSSSEEFQSYFSSMSLGDEWVQRFGKEAEPERWAELNRKKQPKSPLKYSPFILGEDANGEVVQWDSYMNRAMLIAGNDILGRLQLQNQLFRNTVTDSSTPWVKKKLNFDDPESWTLLLNNLLEIKDDMDKRYRLMEEEGASNYADYSTPFPTHLLILECFEKLYAENIPFDLVGDRDEIITIVGYILRVGRAAGMRLIVSGDTKLPGLMKPEMLGNIDVRIATSQMREEASWQLMHSDAASKIAYSGEWLIWFGPQNKLHKILYKKD